jgi:hypothetical protein
MLQGRPADGATDPQEIPDHRGVAERHTGLRHAERARVHADEHDLLGRAAVKCEVRLVRGAGVDERIVDVRHRRLELERVDLGGEPPGDPDQLVHPKILSSVIDGRSTETDNFRDGLFRLGVMK